MSSGLFYLTDKEFSLVQSSSSEGKYDLVHKVPGICVVFFYSVSCPVCKTLFADFKSLPGKVHGVNFAIANVSANNMRIQQMSEASNTVIRYVPYIVVYVDGKFYLEYRGPKRIENITRASYEIAGKILSGKEFTEGKTCSRDGKDGYCDLQGEEEEDVCYTYDEIYEGKVCSLKTGKCYTYGEIYGS